ncbi:MAG TPA: solute carrier family 23 protein [Bauldia sp.]|nr:solute carrier family 23 protein [Bauldia sp.]
MAVRPPGLLYGVDERPPIARLAALGFQYAVLVAVYLITIVITARAGGATPELQADLVSLGLVAAAIGTAIQTWNGPFFGSGYLAPPVFSAIYLAPSVLAARHGGLAAVAGLTIFAGLVEVGLSRLLIRFRVIFQPIIAGFTVFLIGIEFGLVAIAETLDLGTPSTPNLDRHVLVGGIPLAVAVGLSIWGRGLLKLMCSLVALGVGIAVSIALGSFDAGALDTVVAAPWLALPDPTVVSIGFDVSLLPVFAAAGLAATLRTVGVITTAQRVNDAAWKRADVANLSRGVVGDGLGTVAAGFLGAIGMSAAPSMVGLSEATGATSRAIGYATALILFGAAFVPKFAAVVIGLPEEVIGGIFVFVAAFLITGGMQIMMLHGLDIRSGFAISAALLLGLAAKIYPAYFAALPDALRMLSRDMLSIGLTTVVLLMLLFRIGIRKSESTDRQATDAAIVAFRSLLDQEAGKWKLAPDAVDRARDTIDTLVARLAEGSYAEGPIAIASSFDQLELRIDITYRGRPLALGTHPVHAHDTHEEAAMAAGLAHVVVGNQADRTSVTTRDGEVHIRLWFAS